MHIFSILKILSVISVKTDNTQTVAYCIYEHGYLHATTLQMLMLCCLMQTFIIAMLKLHSSIDYSAAVAPQTQVVKATESEDPILFIGTLSLPRTIKYIYSYV